MDLFFWVSVALLPSAMVAIVAPAENCDKFGVLLYEDMACKPHYGRVKSCPIKYDCKGLHKSSSNCYLRGKTYKLLESVDSKLTSSSCDLGCFCDKHKTENATRFKCATLDCPEWNHPPKPNCYRKYSLNSCCSVRQVCPPFDNSTTCLYDGKLYKEGENFLPKNSCWRCVCQEGFRGKIEAPFCRRRSCGIQTKHQNKLQKLCAPIYFKRKFRPDDLTCCPTSWLCADGTEKVAGKATSNMTCRFGNRTLRVGEFFNKQIKDAAKVRQVHCQCRIPPLLTCQTEVI